MDLNGPATHTTSHRTCESPHTCWLKNSRGHVWPREQAAVHQPALLKKTGQFIAAALWAQAGNLVLGQPSSCCSVGVTLIVDEKQGHREKLAVLRKTPGAFK